MNLLNTSDLIGALVSLFLTLMVLSYLLGDNALFRFALHLFVGVSAGMAAAVAVRSVLIPKLALVFLTVEDGTQLILALTPLALSALLLTKISYRLDRLGNPAMAFLVGTGAAVAAGGALTGTIFPQVGAAAASFDLGGLDSGDPLASLMAVINRLLAVGGTLAVLAYFHFSTRRSPDGPVERPAWLERVAGAGRIFIAVTFGMLFAGAYAAALAAWIERWDFLQEFMRSVIGLTG